MTPVAPSHCPNSVAVNRLVPMAHVHDVERSIEFYAKLGFTCTDRLTDEKNRTFWAFLEADRGQLMLVQANPDPDPTQQAILFYLYSLDVAGLRSHLLSAGLQDGSDYCGQPPGSGSLWGVGHGQGVVSTVQFPDYMQHGEIRVEDPDAYCLLIGQLDSG